MGVRLFWGVEVVGQRFAPRGQAGQGSRKGKLMENAVVSEVAAAPAAAAALLSLGGGAQYGLGRDGARGLADGTHTTHRFPVRLASRRTLCRKKKRGRKRCSVLVSAVAALLAAQHGHI